MHVPNLMVYSGEEKLEAFAWSFSNQCAVFLESADINFDEFASEEVPLLMDTPPKSPRQYVTTICKPKPRKASGFDNILN